MSAPDFRADINGLRGLAVALVVAFHLQLRGAAGGFIGVDVFFVLSGYLMTRIVWQGLAQGHFAYGRYLVSRAARIWPALAGLVLALYALGAWRLPPFDLQGLSAQAAWALTFVSNHHYLDHAGYITRAGDTQWLLHTWSLSVEWQFYLLYPLVLMAVWALSAAAPLARRRRLLLWAVGGLMLASLALQLALARRHADAAFFLMPARAWELLAGGWVYLWLRDDEARPLSRWRAAASHLGLALLVLAALALAAGRVRPVGAGAWLVVPVLGAMLILWADHRGNVVLRNPVLQRLGLWSYSIYLWHWPLVIASRMTDYPHEHPLATTLALAAASVVLGAVSYTLIERPAQRARHRAWGWAVAAPLAPMVAAALATALVVATDGLAWRQHQGLDMARYRASVTARYYPDDCSNFKKPPAELKTCTVRKGAPARVLVIGDSHGEHLYAWFVAHSAVSVDFYTAAECPPVPRFERTQAGYRCQDYAALAWARALSPAYDTVIVSARWATVGLAGAPYCHQPEGGDCVAPATLEAKQALVLRELKGAVASALAAGKTVVVLDGAPEARVRVADRVAREQFWYAGVRLSVPVAELRAQTDWFEPLFDAFVGTPGFHRVSVRQQLCDATRCRVHDTATGRPIFFDESHFDPLWIEAQRELFAPFVASR